MSFLRGRRQAEQLHEDEELLEQTNAEMISVGRLLSRLDDAAGRLERVADRLEGRRPRGPGPGR